MYKNIIGKLFQQALNEFNIEESIDIEFEVPKEEKFGDLSTNIAMKLAKPLKKSPKIIAQELINLIPQNNYIESFEIAGPGFINFKFTSSLYRELVKSLFIQKDNLGKYDLGKGKKVNVEYVSCNPTGLLHLGHGRNGALGDAIANFYEALGYDVTREYYFNNAGKQMDNLAESIYARYIQKIENTDFPFPENGYYGDYIKEIADDLIKQYNDQLKNNNSHNKEIIKKFGEQWCFDKIKKTLDRMGIKQQVFYNETSLYEEGKVEEVINYFEEKKLAYEKDGALWLKLSEMGLDDDRVIVKSTGEPTYRLPDIAYHREKYRRGYDIIVDVFGSDHIATVPDIQAAVKFLGLDASKMKVVIHQFVTLTENGQQVKMSKRTGRSYTLDDLLDEVGVDVTKFFFIMRSANTHLEFDLNLAKEQSEKNPVFYLQYAHARICSIFEKSRQLGLERNFNINEIYFEHSSELSLIKDLADFDEVLLKAADRCEPQILSDYLRKLAGTFHNFYHHCRILGSEDKILNSRLILAELTRRILNRGLNLLGISAPEKM